MNGSAEWIELPGAMHSFKPSEIHSQTTDPASSPEKAPKTKVLIVDDEGSIRWALRRTLASAGFEVVEAETGEQALALVRTIQLDVVLLDISMPGMGGIATCKEIRKFMPLIGIVMLTVKDAEDAKIEALDAGADDYVTKPFHIRELAARLRSAARRWRAIQGDNGGLIRIGAIELDPVRRIVKCGGAEVHLTPKEFDLLHYLMSHAGVSLPHAHLLSAVWGPEYRGEVEYLRTFVRQLRKKLGDDAAAPKYLLTDSHFGYRFRTDQNDGPGGRL
jgi:two-component system KDP operon response regulator KdpE